MALQVPRGDSDLPGWYEEVVGVVNALPVTVQARATTTDNTPTVIVSLPILSDKVYHFSYTIAARQVAGSGTIGDGACYVGQLAAHLVSGVATIIGSAASLLGVEDDSNWNATVAGSGNQLQWTVTGANSKTISWRIDVEARWISV